MIKNSQLLTILLFFYWFIGTNQICLNKYNQMLSIIRGNYKNVLHLMNGAIISSRKQNGFLGDNHGSCLNDAIYRITNYTWNLTGNSIIFELIQTYELNTLKLWFWDGDNRIYRFNIYIINETQESLIYDSTSNSIFTLTFTDQFVKGFRILNVSGNTIDQGVHLLKVEAYYYNSKSDNKI
ncbi:unnamed protein product [Paramecium pentaurelia]|uniref:Uncharacterized protein n=1 Tax=Paramecium pentaurelia TaxID=43138 RepID=A0A8S1WNK4_9CILI|nr:unnamed protein product [Paramecium pentaurelia]